MLINFPQKLKERSYNSNQLENSFGYSQAVAKGQGFDINAIVEGNPYILHQKIKLMAHLIVRNIDDPIVKALKIQASRNGVSAEAEHRKILEQVLLHTPQKSFTKVLCQIPKVGCDGDFERIQDDLVNDVFD